MAKTQTEAHFRLGDYLIGVEGLAILRESQRAQFDRMQQRRGEIQAILAGYEQEPLSTPRDLPEANLDEGYTTWSETYDHPDDLDPDPIQATEGPVMRAFIDGLPDGPVLDLACGTGRHTAYIAEKGHEVLGIDANAAMLEHAKKKLPDVEFKQGDLTKIPVDDASYQSVTCGLAFGHLPEIDAAVAELARVLKPGGRVALSAPHPFITGILGWRAPVFDAEGNGWEVPEYPHPLGAYIEAFGKAGLIARECHEPPMSEEHAVWNPEAEPGEENPFSEMLIDALAGQPGSLIWVAEKA
jgi:SAM-dependent methyltransferase